MKIVLNIIVSGSAISIPINPPSTPPANTANIVKSGEILFVFLGLTDFLDGYLARKYNKCTDFGKIIDGIADKFLM